MKKIAVLLFFTYWLTTVVAQNDSIPIGQVVYRRNVDLQSEQFKNGSCVLLFNPIHSLFVYRNAPAKDSTAAYRAENLIEFAIKGDKEGLPIYKNHATNALLVKVQCGKSQGRNCVVADTLEKIPWVFHPEHKRFGPYDGRRATGEFRGRTYEAWYTLDVPVPTGPYKFGGLPGLILEIHSLDGKVQFLFESLEVSNKVSGVIKPPSGKYLGITYAAFNQKEIDIGRKYEKEARAKGIHAVFTVLETIEFPGQN